MEIDTLLAKPEVLEEAFTEGLRKLNTETNWIEVSEAYQNFFRVFLAGAAPVLTAPLRAKVAMLRQERDDLKVANDTLWKEGARFSERAQAAEAQLAAAREALTKIRDVDCLWSGDEAGDACYETAKAALGDGRPG